MFIIYGYAVVIDFWYYVFSALALQVLINVYLCAKQTKNVENGVSKWITRLRIILRRAILQHYEENIVE